MNDYKKDFKYACRVIDQELVYNEKDYEFNGLYLQSNEKLDFIFKDYDFKDKKVLSVLASSDQALSLYYVGAKVDTFDINPLTEYYFYLRKWFIEYGNLVTINYLPNEFIRDLLKKVVVNNYQENCAKKFWQRLLNRYDNLIVKPLFYTNHHLKDVPYIFEDNIELMKERLPKKLAFKKRNFFLPMNYEEEYDALYLSNILDYAVNNIKYLEVAYENVKKLVKSGGSCICTYVRRNPEWEIYREEWKRERNIFSEDFTLEERLLNDKKIYYIYKKRC